MYEIQLSDSEANIDRVVVVAPLAEWTEAYLVARRRAFSRYGVGVVLNNHQRAAAQASRIALVLGLQGHTLLSGVAVHRATSIDGIDLPSAVMLAGMDKRWSALAPGTIELSGTMRTRQANTRDVSLMLEVGVSAIAFLGSDAVGTAPPHMGPRYAALGFAPCPHLAPFEYPKGMTTTPMVMRDPAGMPQADPAIRARMMEHRNNLKPWIPVMGD